MSYQVIARKWRPQTFEEVTGQESITRTLRNAIETKRLHHAFLFAGPRGVGKTTTARLLAKALNCVQGPTANPCGDCPSCQEVREGRSIDVLEIDAASHTGVDNIRDVIINTVANRPARDRYKIFIIDEIHMLSASAFNALLKTLEEPPTHVVFIMATTELHKLPETILSRCQQFEFRTIGTDKIAERLRLIANEEKVTVSRDALVQIAYAGRGSMRDAQSAFDQVIAFTGNQIELVDVQNSLGLIGPQFLAKVVDALAGQDGKGMLLLVDELVRTGYDLRQFLHELMTYLRNLLMLKTVGPDPELLPVAESELKQLKDQAGYFSSEDLVRFFSLLTEVEQHLRFSNEPRFQLEFGLVKLTQLARLKGLETLLERLEKLAGNAPVGPGGPAGTPMVPRTGPASAPGGSAPRPGGNRMSSPSVKAEVAAPSSAVPPVPMKPAETPEVAERLPLDRIIPKPSLKPLEQAQPSALSSQPSEPVRPSIPSRQSSESARPSVGSPPSPEKPKAKLMADEIPPWMDESELPPEPPDDLDDGPPAFVQAPRPSPKPVPAQRPALSVVKEAPAPSAPTGEKLNLDTPNGLATLLGCLKDELENNRKMLLLAAVEKVEQAELEGTDVLLILPPGATELYKQLSQSTNLVFIQEAVRRITGRGLKVRPKLGRLDGGRAAAITESEVQKAALKRQAENDPVVQALIKTFRGELMDIRPV